MDSHGSIISTHPPRYFVAVADAASFSAAAEPTRAARLGLRRQIALLEPQAGLRLVHQCRNGVSVTERGFAFSPSRRSFARLP
jgi:DNA-binding transcriptional LysR family regulator